MTRCLFQRQWKLPAAALSRPPSPKRSPSAPGPPPGLLHCLEQTLVQANCLDSARAQGFQYRLCAPTVTHRDIWTPFPTRHLGAICHMASAQGSHGSLCQASDDGLRGCQNMHHLPLLSSRSLGEAVSKYAQHSLSSFREWIAAMCSSLEPCLPHHSS